MNAWANDQLMGGRDGEKNYGCATFEKTVLGVATCGLTKGGLGIKFFPSGKEGFVDRGTNPSWTCGKGVKLKPFGAGEGGHGWKGGMGKGAGSPVRML
jgi:hypothetical protein